MAIKELNEKQLRACELIANGENNTKTAELVGVNRKTIIAWEKDVMFKAEVGRCVSLLKSKVDEKLVMNIEPIMKKLIDIALKSDSEKTSLDACIYAINRLVGTPTNKVADVTDTKDSDNKKDMSSYLAELEGNDDSNVIDIDDIKKAK